MSTRDKYRSVIDNVPVGDGFVAGDMGPWSVGEGAISVGGLMLDGAIFLSLTGKSLFNTRGSGGARAA
jgi:hypothetical protein